MYLPEQSNPVRWRALGRKACFDGSTCDYSPPLPPFPRESLIMSYKLESCLEGKC